MKDIAIVSPLKGGKISICGEISYRSTATIWNTLQADLLTNSAFELDLEDVTHTDSSAAALLIAIYRSQKKKNMALTIQNTPNQLLAVLKLCNLDPILPIETTE